MKEREQPWTPGPDHTDLDFTLVNPEGDRHIGMSLDEGRIYRIWQHSAPEPLHWGAAVLLRPTDVDTIVRWAALWIQRNPESPHCSAVADELAAGVKAAIDHFASKAR